MENNAVPHNWTDTSPRELSQDVDDERDVDMPYVIGQFKLENKLYSKPFFLSRASTFSEESREKLPRKSNLKRAVSTVGKQSLRSHSSVIYEEIGLWRKVFAKSAFFLIAFWIMVRGKNTTSDIIEEETQPSQWWPLVLSVNLIDTVL